MPFLENVTRGRGIPRERLEEVGEHYYALRRPSARSTTRTGTLLAAIEADLAAARHRPAGLLGQPQLGPLPRPTRVAADDGGRRHPGRLLRDQRLLVVLRRAGSTARTSPTPSRRSAGAPAARQAAALLQPPRLRRADGRRDARRRWPSSPTTRAAARTGLRHPLDPDAMNDGSGPHGGAYLAQHRDAAGDVAERVARGDRAPLRPRPGLLLAVRAAAGAVARARRQRPPREAGRRRGRGRWCWSRSASSPTTWRSSTTSTPRRWPPPSGSGSTPSGPPPPGTDPRFVAMVRDLLLERAAVERGETVDRAAVGGWPPCWDRCAGRAAAPTRAATAAGPVRAGLSVPRPAGRSERPARPRRRRRPRGRRAGRRGCRARGRRGRRHQVQPDRHRHRGRPGRRGLIRERLLGGPARRRVRRRGGRRRARAPAGCVWIVDPIDGTVNYLYGLPHYAVSASPPRSTARSSPGWSLAPALGLRVRRHAAAAGRPATARPIRPRAAVPLARAAGRHRLQLRAAGADPPGRRTSPGCCRGSATSGGSAPAPSTSARWPPARSTPTSRRAPHIWDHAAGGLVAAEAGGTLEVDPLAGREAAADLRSRRRFRGVPGRRRRRRFRAVARARTRPARRRGNSRRVTLCS